MLVRNLPNKYDCLTKAKKPFLLSSSFIKLFISSFIDKKFVFPFLFSSFKLSYIEISISSLKSFEL